MRKTFGFLSQLLPYETSTKKNGLLVSGLKEYQSLLRAALEAVQALHRGDLERFDSLVGENACQIRALRMAIISSRGSIDTLSFEADIRKCLSKVEELLAPESMNSLMRSNATLKEILDSKVFDFPLTEVEMFTIQSFLLSELKDVEIEGTNASSLFRMEAINPKKYKRFGDVSSTFSNSLARKLKKNLASASVKFVRENAAVLQDHALINKVSEEFTVEHNDLPCIPLFWTFKTILLTALKENIPLSVHVKFLKEGIEGYRIVDEDVLFFESAGHHFNEIPLKEVDRPSFVVQGIAVVDSDSFCKKQWKRGMRPIHEVIYANTAHHRQYPDASLDRLFDDLDDAEYNYFKSLAKREGHTHENPTNFFIQHVYTTRAENILEKVSLRKKQLQDQNILANMSPIPARISLNDAVAFNEGGLRLCKV